MFKKGMIRFRRRLATLLTVAMVFSNYPLPAYATAGTADETEVLTEADEENGSVSEDTGLNNQATELYISDISDDVLVNTYIYSGYYIKSDTVSSNGFTINDSEAVPQKWIAAPDKGDFFPNSGNKIRICKNTSDANIPVSSASRGTTNAYLEFHGVNNSISFTTAEDSEVAIVAESTTDGSKLYFKEGEGAVREETLANLNYLKPCTVIFEAEAGTECSISGDPGVRIYFVKLMPKSTQKVWDFTDESLYGQLTDKSIAYAIGYIDGMIVDCTQFSQLRYDEYSSCAKVDLDAKMYVPVYDEDSVVRISAYDDFDDVFLKINGEETAFVGEREFKCVEGDRPGYLTLEFGDEQRSQVSYISKIEILPAKRVTFMASDEEIGEAAFSERLSADSIDVALAVERAVDSAPKGKVFAGWSESENGAKVDLKNAVFEEDKTLYAVYEDASEVSGELYFDEIGDLTDGTRLKYRFATVNGFTVYDTTDSSNSIRIESCDQQSTCVSSANKATESKVCSCDSGLIYYDREGAFISFKPAVDSEIVAVVNSTGVEMGVSDGREIDGSDRYDLGSKAWYKPSLEILEAKADSLCKIRIKSGNKVYFVKIIPKSGKSTWDFTGEDPFGVFGDEISGTMAWVSGLYADTTPEGAKLVKYDTQEDRETKGINLTQGSIIYVPIRANESLFIDAPNGYTNIEVDGKALTAAEESISCNDIGSGERRYIKIEAKNGDADIKKIEVVVTKEKTDVTLTPPVAKTGLKVSATAMELVSGGSVSGGTLYYALGEDDKTAPTGDWKTDIPTAKEAGTYYVWYKAVGDDDHNDTTPAAVTVTVGKADLNLSVSLEGWVYGAEANTPEVTGNTGKGNVTYTYKAKDADDKEYSATVPTAAGTYTVKATVAETDKYNAGTATADFIISKEDGSSDKDDPTTSPSAVPTPVPSAVPTPVPSAVPTPVPSAVPTPVPSAVPTPSPVANVSGDDTVSTKKLELNIKGTQTLGVGGEATIKAAVAGKGSDASLNSVNWVAPSGSVIDTEVQADGSLKIKAVGPGTAFVTAVCGGKTKTVKYNVKQPVNKAEASLNAITLSVKEKYRICVNLDAATTDKFFYATNDKKVCTVNGKGIIAAKGMGTTIVDILAGEKKNTAKKVASVTVTVKNGAAAAVEVKDVSINYVGNKNLYTGEMAYISTLVNGGLGNGGQTVKYSFSTKGIVKIDAYGRLTAKKAGKVIITATCGGKTDTVELTVKQPLKVFKVNKTYVKVKQGKAKTVTLSVKTTPALNKSDIKAVWSVANEGNGVKKKSDENGKAVFEVSAAAKDTVVTANVTDPTTGKTYTVNSVIDVN